LNLRDWADLPARRNSLKNAFARSFQTGENTSGRSLSGIARKKSFRISQITQATILRTISDLVTRDPREYDIIVTGKGEGMERKYTVQPSPHKAVPAAANDALLEDSLSLIATCVGGPDFV
jgi:hypothetical protein